MSLTPCEQVLYPTLLGGFALQALATIVGLMLSRRLCLRILLLFVFMVAVPNFIYLLSFYFVPADCAHSPIGLVLFAGALFGYCVYNMIRLKNQNQEIGKESKQGMPPI